MTQKKKALIYCRVAYDDPDESRLTAQQNLCRSYATSQGYDVAWVITECGSGRSIERPGLNELKIICASYPMGELSIICRDPERLARNPGALRQVLNYFDQQNVRLVFANSRTHYQSTDRVL